MSSTHLNLQETDDGQESYVIETTRQKGCTFNTAQVGQPNAVAIRSPVFHHYGPGKSRRKRGNRDNENVGVRRRKSWANSGIQGRRGDGFEGCHRRARRQ